MSVTVEKCLQAWSNSLRQMKAKADIVFFGDSLTFYGDFSNLFEGKTVCNLGLRGDTLQGLLNRVDQVRMLNPNLVFLMAGINDVGMLSIKDFDSMYRSLVDTIQLELPGAQLIIQSILPVNSQFFHLSCNSDQIDACNKLIRHIALERQLVFMDIFSIYEENGQLPYDATRDGLHLTQDAYNRWYQAIKKIV